MILTPPRRGLFLEDLAEGQVFETPGVTVTEDAIIRFALEWDMQPFHVDAIAARDSVFGSLSASGLHTLLLTYRLYHQLGLLDGTALAGLGFRDVRFLVPLRPGDTLRVLVTAVEVRPSSRPGRGVVVWRFDTRNQDGTVILTMNLAALVRRRDEEVSPDGP